MKTYISLIRGINVSGQKKVPMAELKAVYAALNFKNVRTYIQSGNVIFDAVGAERDIAALIASRIREHFGFEAAVLIRTPSEIMRILAHSPFDEPEKIKNLYVVFMPEPPDKVNVDTLAPGPEQWRVSGREIYLYCPDGMGKAKLNNQYFEHKLKTTATTRNWNTLQQLAQRAR